MDFKFLYLRVRNLLLMPERAWTIIHAENRPIRDIRGSFFLPLITLAGIAAFLGALLFAHPRPYIFDSIFLGVRYFVLLLAATYLTAIILNEITNALDLGKDFVKSFKLIGYSLTPFYLCQIVSLLFDDLFFVMLLSIYVLYIFWIGMEKMLNPPDHKKMALVVSTWISFIIIYVACNKVLEVVIEFFYNAFFV